MAQITLFCSAVTNKTEVEKKLYEQIQKNQSDRKLNISYNESLNRELKIFKIETFGNYNEHFFKLHQHRYIKEFTQKSFIPWKAVKSK